jgi:hypothetical protein
MLDSHAGAIRILGQTQPWVRFASLVGLLLGGLMVSFGADALVGGFASRRFDMIPGLLLSLLLGAAFLVPALYLHKYARRIKVFVAQGHQGQLEAALEVQRKFWKYTGVLWLTVFTVLALAAAFAII